MYEGRKDKLKLPPGVRADEGGVLRLKESLRRMEEAASKGMKDGVADAAKRMLPTCEAQEVFRAFHRCESAEDFERLQV